MLNLFQHPCVISDVGATVWILKQVQDDKTKKLMSCRYYIREENSLTVSDTRTVRLTKKHLLYRQELNRLDPKRLEFDITTLL